MKTEAKLLVRFLTELRCCSKLQPISSAVHSCSAAALVTAGLCVPEGHIPESRSVLKLKTPFPRCSASSNGAARSCSSVPQGWSPRFAKHPSAQGMGGGGGVGMRWALGGPSTAGFSREQLGLWPAGAKLPTGNGELAFPAWIFIKFGVYFPHYK